MFECFPTRLEKKALLGIHDQRFARSNSEKIRIEFRYLIKKPAIACRNLAGCIRVRIEILINRPSVGWNLSNSITPFPQKCPICVGTIRTRKTAADTDHRNRLTRDRLNSIEAFLE